ncbi:MAG: hypothetical protein ACREB5_10560, partial [Sphingomonadaceae bacterium]
DYASKMGSVLRPPSTRTVMRHLLEERRISGAAFELLNELYALRNAAAHYKEVSVTDAVRFQALAETARSELDRVGGTKVLFPRPPSAPD